MIQINYTLLPNTNLGYEYVYAAWNYQEKKTPVIVDTSSWGTHFSIFIAGPENGTEVEIKASSLKSSIKGESYWKVNVTSTLKNYVFPKLGIKTADGKNPVMWDSVHLITILPRNQTAFGTFYVALLTFTNVSTPLTTFPFYNRSDINDTVISTLDNRELFEDFEDGYLDPQKWLVARRYWGGCLDGIKCNQLATGGAIPENVHLEEGPRGERYLRLEVHGNYYNGSLLGVDRQGNRRTDPESKKRKGAAIVTHSYYGSASYRVRAKLTRFPEKQDNGGGVVNAFWTFHYEEFQDGKRINSRN